MKRPRNKFIVYAVAVFGIAVLVASGFALKRPVLERWYLSKLASAERYSERKSLARKLGEIHSVKAIPQLIGLVRLQARERPEGEWRPQLTVGDTILGPPSASLLHKANEDHSHSTQYEVGNAMVRIGRPSVHDLIRGLKDEFPLVRCFCAEVLGEIGATPRSVNALIDALRGRPRITPHLAGRHCGLNV